MQTLIMDLTLEQGASRITQVQPPKNVWANYFELDLDAYAGELPTLIIQDYKNQQAPEERQIVSHDHNWTLELSDATAPRPAIVRMLKSGPNAYRYWVYRPGDAEFQHLDWLLDTAPNPQRIRGRRWLTM